jgi:hypothetical protein
MKDARYYKIESMADMDTLTEFASQANFAVEEDITEQELVEQLHLHIIHVDLEIWNKKLSIECKNWANAVTRAIKEVPEEVATKTPKTPKPKTTVATAKTKKSEPEEKDNAEIIAACKTKKAVIDAAKDLGCTLKISMSWKLADMKAKVIENLNEQVDPSDEEVAPVAQVAVERIEADASAPDPSKNAVKTAKAAAKATAEQKKASKGKRTKVEGEPFSRGTTSWMVWNAFNRTKKKSLTMKEATSMFMTEFEKSGLKSANPTGRVKRTIAHMVNGIKIMKRNEDGSYSLI